MKTLTSYFKKLILIAMGSVIAATILILVNTTTSTKNKEHNEEIQRQIENIEYQINKLQENIKNRSVKGWKKYLNKTKNVYDELQIGKLRGDQYVLTGKRLGADPSYLQEFKDNWKLNIFKYSLYIFLLLVFSPILVSLFTYYVIARLVEKSAPITALKKDPTTKNIDMKKARAALTAELTENEHLYLRGGWKGASNGVQAKTKFMWKWNAPLITFAADLFELVDYSVEKNNGSIIITAPEPDLYIGEIILHNSALVIRPRHLIGITDGIKIKTVWSFKLHNILAGKIRQVILYGNGRVFIYGTQGIEENDAIQKEFKIEAFRILGYDAHSAYSLCRTETWWHYFRKEATLFDVKIQKGTFLTQTISKTYMKQDQNGIEKCVNFILNGIGSFLGL